MDEELEQLVLHHGEKNHQPQNLSLECFTWLKSAEPLHGHELPCGVPIVEQLMRCLVHDHEPIDGQHARHFQDVPTRAFKARQFTADPAKVLILSARGCTKVNLSSKFPKRRAAKMPCPHEEGVQE